MKTTPTCSCGRWVRGRENTAWYSGPRNLVIGAVRCENCGEELPANPECEAEVPEPKTVTLTSSLLNAGDVPNTIFRFSSIDSLGLSADGTVLVTGKAHGQITIITAMESAAEITRLARKVFGEGWDCEGAVPRLEQEPKTVTLHHYSTGEPRCFSSITKIHGYSTVTDVYGQCGDIVLSLVTESPAEITTLAREAWGDEWNCEGAVPRVIALSVVCGGGTCEYRSITSITGGHLSTQVVGVCRYPGRGGWHDTGAPASVTESPAEITRKARAVWGDDWSCPGCVDPVVVLHWTYNDNLCSGDEPTNRDGSPVRFYSITAITIRDNWPTVFVEGDGPQGWYGCGVYETEAEARAAAKTAGVPCCEAETTDVPDGPVEIMREIGRTWANVCNTMGALGKAIRQGFAEEVEQADAERDELDPLMVAIAAKVRVGLPKHMVETDSESQTLTLYDEDGVTVAATLTMRDGGVLEYKEGEELVAAETTSEYPAAWERTILPGSFVAYCCAVSVWKRDDGWSYSVNSPDHTHGANADSGLTQGQAIAGADMLARAWGNEKQQEG